MNRATPTLTTQLRQLLASTLPPYIPFVRMERSKEVEDKVIRLCANKEKTFFICGGVCSLCAYQEEDNLRVLTPEETSVFHKLIKNQECRCFCESCFKMVIKMIRLSKEVETLQSRLTQSVTCVRSVLRIDSRSSPQTRRSSSPDSVSEDDFFDPEIDPDEEDDDEVKNEELLPPRSPIDVKVEVKLEEEEYLEEIMPEIDEREDSQNERNAFYCHTCKLQYKEHNFKRHLQTLKHKQATGKEPSEIQKKYYCETCKKLYYNFDKYKYERHIRTTMHLKKLEVVVEEPVEKSIARGKRKSKAKTETLIEATSSDEDNNLNEDEESGSDLEYSEKNIKRKRRNSSPEISDTEIKEELPESDDAGFKCNCGISFHTKVDLRTHEKKERCAAKCDLCKKGFSRPEHHLKSQQHQFNLKCPEDRRIYISWTKENGRFYCPCGKSYSQKHELKKHKDKVHYGFFHVHCDLCDKKYSKADYSKHLLSKEHILKLPENQRGDLSQFLCETCGKHLASQICLKRHIKNVHLGLKPFACDQCDKAFTLKAHLKRHMEIHTGKAQCESCGKLFTSSEKLRGHVKRIHMERTLIKCPNCEMYLVDSKSLRHHIEVRHKTLEERCFCPSCNENFPSLLLKKEHDRIVHNRGSSYHCEKCPRIFHIKRSFDLHMRAHNKERPFACGKCNKSYVKKSSLDDHYKSVCGGDEEAREKVRKIWRETTARFRAAKKHKCEKCGDAFGQKQQFNYHMKKHEEAGHNISCK